jgi:hypothetical protein
VVGVNDSQGSGQEAAARFVEWFTRASPEQTGDMVRDVVSRIRERQSQGQLYAGGVSKRDQDIDHGTAGIDHDIDLRVDQDQAIGMGLDQLIPETGRIRAVDIPTDVDLIRRLRTLNVGRLRTPWMWSLVANPARQHGPVGLGVGVNGATGVLRWITPGGRCLVPEDGMNTEPVLYRLAGIRESYMPVGSEVPIETVYAVVAEFLRTHRLPQCIRWRPAGWRSDPRSPVPDAG